MIPWLRSLLAVLGGFVAMTIIVVAATSITVKAMHIEMGHPTRPYMAINLLYSFAAAVIGGYVTAWIAGRSPLAHGIALALFLLVMSGISAAQSWGMQPGVYLIALAAGSPVFCMLGAWLRAVRG